MIYHWAMEILEYVPCYVEDSVRIQNITSTTPATDCAQLPCCIVLAKGTPDNKVKVIQDLGAEIQFSEKLPQLRYENRSCTKFNIYGTSSKSR